MLELPPSYWNDINRYCGEIFSKRPPITDGSPLLNMQVQEASWPALTAADKVASLDRHWFVFLFGAIKCKQHYHLRFSDSEPKADSKLGYAISFDPVAEQILQAGNSEAWERPEGYTGFRGRMKYTKERNDEYETIKQLGLHLPHQKDAETLLAELERGAELI